MPLLFLCSNTLLSPVLYYPPVQFPCPTGLRPSSTARCTCSLSACTLHSSVIQYYIKNTDLGHCIRTIVPSLPRPAWPVPDCEVRLSSSPILHYTNTFGSQISISLCPRSRCVSMTAANMTYHPWDLTNSAMSRPRHLIKEMGCWLGHGALLADFPPSWPMPLLSTARTEQRVNIEAGRPLGASYNQDTITSTRARARFACIRATIALAAMAWRHLGWGAGYSPGVWLLPHALPRRAQYPTPTGC